MALIEIVPTTTMEEVLRVYPSANVALLQRYHVGGCESHSHTPTELPVEKVRELMQLSHEPVSIDGPIGDGETLLGELLEDRATLQPLDAVIEKDLAERVTEALATHTHREAHVLRHRYGIGTDEEHTLKKVAQDLGVTSKGVRQIEVKALASLRQLRLLQGLTDVSGFGGSTYG